MSASAEAIPTHGTINGTKTQLSTGPVPILATITATIRVMIRGGISTVVRGMYRRGV